MKRSIASALAAMALGVGLVSVVATWDDPELEADDLNSNQLRTAVETRLSVTDAVAIAEKYTGGSVLEATYSYLPLKGAPIYALRTYQNGAVWATKIDANSGEMLDPGETIPREALDLEDKAELSGLQTSTITITQAIQIAERRAKGKAVSVDLEVVGAGGIFWRVIVVSNGMTRKLLIDPSPAKWAYQRAIAYGQ
jgi:uncharacterized membrane protein YkoI